MGTHPIFESDFDCLTEMLRVGHVCKRNFKQVINRFFIPELAPTVTESKPAYETIVNADLIKRNVSEVAANVPSIDFGNLCLENIAETGTKSVKRNQTVSAVWTPIEKNVLGIVTNYSYPKAHGIFAKEGAKLFISNRGLIERLDDEESDSLASEFYQFMFHESAIQNVSSAYPLMPVVFDIVGLVNNVREPMNPDGDDLEDNPFVTDEENPLLRMDSIGLIEEANEDTEASSEESEGSEEVEQEEDGQTEDKIEDRKFLMAWNVRPISVKNLTEEKIQNFEEIEDELKIELTKNISEFEERSMENTIEYLKLRLERIKRTFETEKYQEIMNLEIGETEILQTKDHNYLRDWTVPAELPLNWDETLKPNYNRVIMNPKKRQAKFGFSA